MGKHRVAVLGVRNIGFAHARDWAREPDVELVAVADLDESLRRRAAEALGLARSFADYREVLSSTDADIIDVCLPTFMHEQVVRDCLQSGRHGGGLDPERRRPAWVWRWDRCGGFRGGGFCAPVARRRLGPWCWRPAVRRPARRPLRGR